jgi:hypothetical protein
LRLYDRKEERERGGGGREREKGIGSERGGEMQFEVEGATEKMHRVGEIEEYRKKLENDREKDTENNKGKNREKVGENNKGNDRESVLHKDG